jgi:hypothetical protein
MRTDKSIIRMAGNVTPPLDKTRALLATMYKGFASNGTTLTIELFEL